MLLRALPVLLALLVLAAPAPAATVWSAPQPVGPKLATAGKVAAAADGTLLRTGTSSPVIEAQLGEAPPVTLPFGSPYEIGVAPGGQAVVAGSRGGDVVVARARPDGTFTDPVSLGRGTPGAVAVNAAGAVAVVVRQEESRCPRSPVCVHTFHNALHSAAPGAAFGPAEALPDGFQVDLSLADDSGALVLVGGDSVTANSRPAGRQLLPPHRLSATVPSFAGALDAEGRAFAAWTGTDLRLTYAKRDADGTWSAPQALAEDAAMLDVGVSAPGDVVLAWSPPPADGRAPLRVATGAIDGPLGDPVTLAADVDDRPRVAIGPDGAATVLAHEAATQSVRVARRAGTGPFAPLQVAACAPAGLYPDIELAGLDTVRVGTTFTRDTGVEGTPRTCPLAEPAADPGISLSAGPVVVGEPVTVTARVRRPDYDIVRVVLAIDTLDQLVEAASRTHTFTTPGWHGVLAASRQAARHDGTIADFTDVLPVDVHARASLAARRTITRRALRRRGLRVRANAFTGSRPRAVVVRLARRGRVLARRTVQLGAVPSGLRLPRTRVARGRARLALVQDGAVVARRTLRIR